LENYSTDNVILNKKTKTILCAPVRLPNQQTIGVLQSTNKLDGIFSPLDEHIISSLATLSAVSLLNEDKYRLAAASIEKYRSLLTLSGGIVSGTAMAEGISLLSCLTQRTASILEADRAALYLFDAVSKCLYAMQDKVIDYCPQSFY
jgi:hypothetical protein